MSNGSNNWNVSFSTIRFVENALASHEKVLQSTRRNDIVFDIRRAKSLPPVTMVLVNRYTLGIADFYECRSEFPGMTCLVTSSTWNQYTSAVKDAGKRAGVSVFNISEFFGALHWSDMVKYVPKKSNSKLGKRSRRSS